MRFLICLVGIFFLLTGAQAEEKNRWEGRTLSVSLNGEARVIILGKNYLWQGEEGVFEIPLKRGELDRYILRIKVQNANETASKAVLFKTPCLSYRGSWRIVRTGEFRQCKTNKDFYVRWEIGASASRESNKLLNRGAYDACVTHKKETG